MKTNTYYSKKTRNKFMSLFFNPYLLKGLEVVNAYELKVREIIDYGDVIKRYRFDDIVQYDLMLDNRRIFPGVYEPVIQFIDDLLTVMTLDELLHVKWSRWAMAMQTNKDLPEIIASMGIITEKVRNDLTTWKVLSQTAIIVMNKLFIKRRNKVRIEAYLKYPPLRKSISPSFDEDLKHLVGFLQMKGFNNKSLEYLIENPLSDTLKHLSDYNIAIVDDKLLLPVSFHYLIRLYVGHALKVFRANIENIDLNSGTYREFVSHSNYIKKESRFLLGVVNAIIFNCTMISLAGKPTGCKELNN